MNDKDKLIEYILNKSNRYSDLLIELMVLYNKNNLQEVTIEELQAFITLKKL